MEDLEQYMRCLQGSALLAGRLEKLLEEDKEDSRLGLSGEAEQTYRSHCDKASEKLKEIQKKAMILYSESSAGLI